MTDPSSSGGIRAPHKSRPTTGEPRRNLGVGAAIASSGQLINAVLGAATSIVVARLLGPTGTGGFAILLSTVFFVSTVSTLGVDTGLIYRASGGRWHVGDAMRQAQLAAFALGCLGAALAGAVAVPLADSAFAGIETIELAMALAAVPAALSLKIASGIALSLERYVAHAVANTAQVAALLLLVAALAPVFGFGGAATALLASYAIAAAALLGWTARTSPQAEPGWLRRAPRELLAACSFGIRAYTTTALSYLNQRADLFILNAFAASAAVGWYSIAVSITSLGLLLPRALSAVAMPRIAALDAGDGEHARGTAVASVRHAVAITAMCTVGLAAMLPAIPLVYGNAFASAVGLGYILLPGVALFGLASVLTAIVVGKGRPQYPLYTALIVTPPTLLAYFLLVPSLDAAGAALASTASYAGSFLALLHFFRRVTGARRALDLMPGAAELRDYRLLAAAGLARVRR